LQRRRLWFILIFLLLANAFTFYLGGFFERGQADLQWFCYWASLAVTCSCFPRSMRLGPRSASPAASKLLMTQPVTLWEPWGQVLCRVVVCGPRSRPPFPSGSPSNTWATLTNGTILAAYNRQPDARRRLFAIGLVHVRADQQPGHCLYPGSGWRFWAAGRLSLVMDAFRSWAQWLMERRLPVVSQQFDYDQKGVIDNQDCCISAMLSAFSAGTPLLSTCASE